MTAPTSRAGAVAALLVAVAACSGGAERAVDAGGGTGAGRTTPAGEGQAVRFGEPEAAGLCEDVTVEWAHDEPGYDSEEEAVAAFARYYDVLDDTRIEGTTILFAGEEVGAFELAPAPAGGQFVSNAWWCYPDE